jgi:hypothetical protein
MPPAINRPQKITFAEMRSSGVRGIPDLLLGLPVQPSCRDHGRPMERRRAVIGY